MARISLIIQEGHLKSVFPDSKTNRRKEEYLSWEHTLTPSNISNTYKVKLNYKRGEGVNFKVLEPKLELAEGKTSLPHVYSTDRQELCLYYPKSKEWDSSMLFTKTIIPWACEWLLHYEIWQITGEWHGGGVHSNVENIEQEKTEQLNEIKE
ncbi:hypothetical protein GCM10028805_65140 [Spirosoma harenae]